MQIKPFNLSHFRKVSEEEIKLTDAILELFPSEGSRDRLNVEIRKTMMKHLGEKSFYYIDTITTQTYSQFVGTLPETSIVAVINLEPSQTKVFVHIDQNIGFLLIDRLLGGASEPAIENRPLSETEAGVLQYLVMQILAQVWKVSGGSSKHHFRLEKFVYDPREISHIVPKNETAVEVTFKVGVGELAGFIKILLPKGLIMKLEAVSERKDPAPEDMRHRIGRFDHVRTTLWAEAGRATISSQDIITLEAGDVVLFDETGLSLHAGTPSGEVDLRVGKGEEAGIRAKAETINKEVKCTIIGA